MNDADRRYDKIHECGDKSGGPVAAVSREACGRRLLA